MILRMTTSTILLVVGLMATPALSKDKNHDWQMGKLVSIEEGDAREAYVQSGVVILPVKYKTWIYAVETETMRYELSAQSDKPRPLTINNQVEFALEPKGKAFLLDEGGKEFKASVVKKAAKQPAR